MLPINYERQDVDYATFYSDWMKRLALGHTKAELLEMLGIKSAEASRAAAGHLRAIQRTTSMQGASAARAHGRNVTAAAGDAAIAVRGALAIHQLFPEFAKQATQWTDPATDPVSSAHPAALAAREAA